MADTNPFANLGLQQLGRENRFVGQTFGEPMQDIKKLAGAYFLDKSGIKDWANRTFGKAPPTGLEKPELVPDSMSAGPGFNAQNPSGMGLRAGGVQGFNLGVAPPAMPAMGAPIAPAVPPAISNPQYDPTVNNLSPIQSNGSDSQSIFDEAMGRFGLKKYGSFGG